VDLLVYFSLQCSSNLQAVALDDAQQDAQQLLQRGVCYFRRSLVQPPSTVVLLSAKDELALNSSYATAAGNPPSGWLQTQLCVLNDVMAAAIADAETGC